MSFCTMDEYYETCVSYLNFCFYTSCILLGTICGKNKTVIILQLYNNLRRSGIFFSMKTVMRHGKAKVFIKICHLLIM